MNEPKKVIEPIISNENREKGLKEMEDIIRKMGIDTDVCYKLPGKYIMRLSQASSEMTATIMLKKLDDLYKNLNSEMKTYVIQNILPDDYKTEQEICSNINQLWGKLKAIEIQLKAMSNMIDEISNKSNPDI